MGPLLRRYIGYPLFFIVCFVFFSYWTFPYYRVRDWVQRQAAAQLGPDYQLSIVDLEPSWFTGATLTGVRITKKSSDENLPPLDITFDEVTARTGLFAALSGETDVSFSAELGGGTIDGSYQQDGDEIELEVDLDEVDLRRLGLLRASFGIPLRGKATGTIDISMPAEVSQSEGEITLAVEGLQIGAEGTKVPLPGFREGLTIDGVRAGKLDLAVDIERGVGTIRTLQSRGPDATLDGNGEIRLMRPIGRARLNTLLRVKFTDTYRERSDRTQALFSLMEMTPSLRPAKTSDGALQYRISGSFAGRMNTRPAGRENLSGTTNNSR